MTRPNRKPCRTSARDRKILDHVARHRITTNQVLQKLFFPQNGRNAVTKVTARLCRDDRLSRFTFRHPRIYYTLGPSEAQRRGLPISRTQPLGPQSLPTEYSVLAYATLGSCQHHRLTSSELQHLCPWLAPQLLDWPHCLDESSQPPILELIRVDLGGKPDHVARKCHADIRTRRPSRDFHVLLRERRFRLVVVTGTSEKATAIQAAIDQHVWPDGLQIHLVVIPDLLLLTASSDYGP